MYTNMIQFFLKVGGKEIHQFQGIVFVWEGWEGHKNEGAQRNL